MDEMCELTVLASDEERNNNDANGLSFPEYQLVAQLWVSEKVNDGQYQIM